MPREMIESGGRVISLEPQQLDSVCLILQRVLAAESDSDTVQAWVFGSRATGRARPFSDLDILISRPVSLGWRDRADLQDAFEASDLPFKVDIAEASRLQGEFARRVASERLPLPLWGQSASVSAMVH